MINDTGYLGGASLVVFVPMPRRRRCRRGAPRTCKELIATNTTVRGKLHAGRRAPAAQSRRQASRTLRSAPFPGAISEEGGCVDTTLGATRSRRPSSRLAHIVPSRPSSRIGTRDPFKLVEETAFLRARSHRRQGRCRHVVDTLFRFPAEKFKPRHTLACAHLGEETVGASTGRKWLVITSGTDRRYSPHEALGGSSTPRGQPRLMRFRPARNCAD